jgi:hypothetical protein
VAISDRQDDGHEASVDHDPQLRQSDGQLSVHGGGQYTVAGRQPEVITGQWPRSLTGHERAGGGRLDGE